MNIDPQLAPFVAGAAQFPKTGSITPQQLREAVRAASAAFPPLAVEIEGTRDLAIEGPGGPLPLRVYRPKGNGPFPAIVYFHGGGWVVGDLDTQDMIARGLCHAAGAVVVSVDYRLAPEHPFPAAVDDCWAATRWAGEHAAEIGAKPGVLAVAGDSAGASLAAGVALLARDAGGPALCGQVMFYGSCTYPDRAAAEASPMRDAPFLSIHDLFYFWHLYLSDPAKEQDHPLVSPVRAPSHAGLPAAFVCTAENDITRDDGEAYGRTLIAAGVPVTARRYPGMVHGFVSWLGLIDGARAAMDDAGAFLKMQFARA